MKTKYTPGPWEYVGDVTHAWNIRRVGSNPEAADCDPANGGVVGSSEWIWMDEANARLIAAAPELLEALQGMVAAFQRLNFATDMERHLANMALVGAEEAIAKATGQTPDQKS